MGLGAGWLLDRALGRWLRTWPGCSGHAGACTARYARLALRGRRWHGLLPLDFHRLHVILDVGTDEAGRVTGLLAGLLVLLDMLRVVVTLVHLDHDAV